MEWSNKSFGKVESQQVATHKQNRSKGKACLSYADIGNKR